MDKLIPEVQAEHLFIPIGELPSIEVIGGQKPPNSFINSMIAGQLQPIILVKRRNGFEVVAGRRRILAAHYGALPGLWAMVYEPGDINPHLAALTENHQRSPNPISDYYAITALLEDGTVEQVAAQLNLPVATVKAAYKLQFLEPELLQLTLNGGISIGVAVKIAAKPRGVQKRLIAISDEGWSITGQIVQDVARVAAEESKMPELPFMIPESPKENVRFLSASPYRQDKIKIDLWRNGIQESLIIEESRLLSLIAA